jgi:hypothetical protein
MVTTIAIVATGSARLPLVVGVLSAIVMTLPSRMWAQETPARAD